MSAMPERPTTPISVTIGIALFSIIVGLIALMWAIAVIGTLLKYVFLIVVGAAVLTAVVRLSGPGD